MKPSSCAVVLRLGDDFHASPPRGGLCKFQAFQLVSSRSFEWARLRPVETGGQGMVQFMRSMFLIAAVTLNCEAALAQAGRNSANDYMPGCRSFESDKLGDPYLSGFCIGTISTLASVGPAFLNICMPGTATIGQAIRIVVRYIDGQPARLHESFVVLATEALRAAWPCKR